MIVSLLISLWIIAYFVFSGFTVYFVIIGKRSPEKNVIGNLIYYHGVAVICSLISMPVLAGALILANVIMNTVDIRIFIP